MVIKMRIKKGSNPQTSASDTVVDDDENDYDINLDRKETKEVDHLYEKLLLRHVFDNFSGVLNHYIFYI